MQNIIESTKYVETINKLDNLVNELLYSQNSGFINLSSKEAILEAQKTVEKFNFEADKIAREYSISDIDEIIKDKKLELQTSINKHCSKQIFIWVDEVFNNMADNCIFKASVNSSDNDLIKKIYARLLAALDWVSGIKNYSKEDKNKILKSLNYKFNKALKSKDSDFISKQSPLKSDLDLYFKLRKLITDDTDEFLKLNFNDYSLKLTQNDINYFIKLQNKIRINKTSVIDDINLINYALETADIKDISERYCFINKIKDDFNNLKDEEETSKTEIIKRRIELYKNKNDYYKKLLGF